MLSLAAAFDPLDNGAFGVVRVDEPMLHNFEVGGLAEWIFAGHHSPFGVSFASSAAFMSQRAASVRDGNRCLNRKSSRRLSNGWSRRIWTICFSSSFAAM